MAFRKRKQMLTLNTKRGYNFCPFCRTIWIYAKSKKKTIIIQDLKHFAYKSNCRFISIQIDTLSLGYVVTFIEKGSDKFRFFNLLAEFLSKLRFSYSISSSKCNQRHCKPFAVVRDFTSLKYATVDVWS